MSGKASGYSGTPLAKKLGIGVGVHLLVLSAPEDYEQLLAPLPTGVKFESREVALPLGYVDIKVCAVSEVWSGLKLVVRKELRPAPQ